MCKSVNFRACAGYHLLELNFLSSNRVLVPLKCCEYMHQRKKMSFSLLYLSVDSVYQANIRRVVVVILMYKINFWVYKMNTTVYFTIVGD